MDFVVELKKQNMNIRICSQKSGIPYATLYPIIKGQVDIGTCTYYTVEKLAKVLGYRPDQIVYHKEDFQTFRNNLHHDYIKMLYLVATVDYISKKYSIPLSNKYDEIRKMKLEEPFFVGDALLLGKKEEAGIKEFAKYNIIEGDLYDAV